MNTKNDNSEPSSGLDFSTKLAAFSFVHHMADREDRERTQAIAVAELMAERGIDDERPEPVDGDPATELFTLEDDENTRPGYAWQRVMS